MVDCIDEKIIRRVQTDFPLTAAPYLVMAADLGIDEEELLRRLRLLKEQGILRKMGAVLQHRIAGFHGNALCCWNVPESRLQEVINQLTVNTHISHVYLRQPHARWPYNLYTVFHSHTREACLEWVQETAKALDIHDFQPLFSRRNWKRSQLLLL